VILYTCGQEKSFASVGHACGRAARALDESGYEYELQSLPGYKYVPWTWRARRRGREKIEELTGKHDLPVLVLDEGKVVAGSGKIVEWAQAHPAYQEEVGGG
jgi:glutaredoxin